MEANAVSYKGFRPDRNFYRVRILVKIPKPAAQKCCY